MSLVYGIQKRQFVDSVLTGEGARLNGGRWNPAGTPLLHTSTTPELALLGILVHLDGTPLRDLPPFVLITIEMPDAIEELAVADFPPGWDRLKYPDTLPLYLLPKLTPIYPALGFSLPSVILKNSPTRNVLISPLHPLIGQVNAVSIVAQAFDERLS